jgi:hypothetical protein
MAGLIKLGQRALTRIHAPSHVDTDISTSALATSRSAAVAVAKGGGQNALIMAQTVPMIHQKLTQARASQVADNLGKVIQDAKETEIIKPAVLAAAKAHVQAAANRAQMATAIGGASQKVSVMNAQAQNQLQTGHVQASFQTQLAQASSRFAV